MKSLITSMSPLFIVTAFLTHCWTVVIAFEAGGSGAAAGSFFLPILSEIYWMIIITTNDQIYTWITLFHLGIVALIVLFYIITRTLNSLSKTQQPLP